MALALRVSPDRVLFHGFLNISFLLFLFFLLFAATTTKTHPNSSFSTSSPILFYQKSFTVWSSSGGSCEEFEGLKDHKARCAYLENQTKTGSAPCGPQGYINYLRLFYCTCGGAPISGYILLFLWLVVLFYLLGNTASDYFCASLEGLSAALRLSPAVAGVTLLSLGNGAPDVFASLVSFTTATTTGAGGGEEVGISSVLGGAFFVSTVVVGVIAVAVDVFGGGAAVDKACFFRDAGFLAAALASLLAVLLAGKITFWGAIGFVSLYFVYVFVVSATHCCRKEDFAGELAAPLLGGGDAEKEDLESGGGGRNSELGSSPPPAGSQRPPNLFLWLLLMPLYLPRRLTIPVVSEEKWSKPFAVLSVIFAPILLATLWNSQRGELGLNQKLEIFLISGLIGIVLGITALETTRKTSPPKRFLFPWLAGGFLMSMVWAYITAKELVSLLVSLGYILGISPSILGLTVLAWGNSVGDLTANVAMAVSGVRHGAQVAVSGCYAGPVFNTLVGLGLSLLYSAWSVHPLPLVIPSDPSFFETLGFLMAGLLWAVVILPRRGMELDRVLGVGLLAIYLCFLSLRITESLGLVKIHGA